MQTIEDFQGWIWNWMLNTFGPREEIAKDRSFRFLEEAIELAQATDVTEEDAAKLVAYVYSREKGTVMEEVGDVMLTLAGVASANGVSMEGAADAVQARAVKNAEKIAAKRKLRPTDGDPLPTAEPETMYTIWCEWDIGQGAQAYTEEGAKRAARTMWDLQDMEESFDEVWDDGYIGIEPIEVNR
jgi:NTP pyrophosphatase (non-canonical NTP hydrolase)